MADYLQFPNIQNPSFPIEISYEDIGLRSKKENGDYKIRKKFTYARKTFKLKWNSLSYQDYSVLEDFYINKCQTNVKMFAWTYPSIASGLNSTASVFHNKTFVVRFVSVSTKAVEHSYFVVEITLLQAGNFDPSMIPIIPDPEETPIIPGEIAKDRYDKYLVYYYSKIYAYRLYYPKGLDGEVDDSGGKTVEVNTGVANPTDRYRCTTFDYVPYSSGLQEDSSVCYYLSNDKYHLDPQLRIGGTIQNPPTTYNPPLGEHVIIPGKYVFDFNGIIKENVVENNVFSLCIYGFNIIVKKNGNSIYVKNWKSYVQQIMNEVPDPPLPDYQAWFVEQHGDDDGFCNYWYTTVYFELDSYEIIDDNNWNITFFLTCTKSAIVDHSWDGCRWSNIHSFKYICVISKDGVSLQIGNNTYLQADYHVYRGYEYIYDDSYNGDISSFASGYPRSKMLSWDAYGSVYSHTALFNYSFERW